jgi:DNA-binding beta-propeller fold protein YncE
MRCFAVVAVVVAVVCAGCPEGGEEGEGEGEGEGEACVDVGPSSCAGRSLGPSPSTSARGVLRVLAGEGGAGFVDGQGAAARFNGVGGIGRFDGCDGGFWVVSDIFNGTLRKIDDDGVVTTVLGAPLDTGAVDGTCADVRNNGPRGLAVDPRDGSVWYGDGPCLRHADLDSGATVTVAGDCVSGGFVDGDLGAARFGFLFHDVELDAVRGRVYVADRVNDAVRVVDLDAGAVSTLADGFDGPGALALDEDGGVLFVADTFHNAIVSIDVDSGAVTTVAGGGAAGADDGPAADATLDAPQALALDGTRLVFGGFDGKLRALDLLDERVTTLADDTAGFFAPFGAAAGRLLLADIDGGLFVVDGDDVAPFAGAARPVGYVDGAGPDARFALPASIVRAPAGDGGDAVFVSDSINNAIRVVSLVDGATTTLIGSPDRDDDVDGAFADAGLDFPAGLAIDDAGAFLYVAANGAGSIKRLDLAHETVETVAVVDDPWEVALDEANDKLYVVSSAGGALVEVDLAAGSQRTVASGFAFPIGVAVAAGRVFVADNEQHALFEVDVDSGDKTVVLGTLGFQGPAAGSQAVALLSFPSSLSSGVEAGDDVLYVAETGGQVVRRVLLRDFSSTFVVGDPQLSGALPAGASVVLDGAPLLNPQDAVVVDGDIVIAGDTTVVLARP